MALMNSLLSSWNFNNLSGSDSTGSFLVSDVSNTYHGQGISFATASVNFILKEDIKSNKKVSFEFVEGKETIQTLEEDDNKIDNLHKPSSLQLIFENSMYQIISEEMMNMFSTINAYSFKFAEPFNLYKPEYNKLEQVRHEFFSKILEKPNLEKYLEFYKWLDSSLGYMLEQLRPESASNIKGLKNTIESHALERNKYQYKLPLTIAKNKNYTAGVSVTSKNTLKQSNIKLDILDTIDDVVEIENKLNFNFKNNYEIINTAGKILNNRGNKLNKTVFQTRFSSVDHLSDLYRDASGEYSIYNFLNNRAVFEKIKLNATSSLGLDIQGTNSVGNFEDNNFIQRNIPYTASNYSNANKVNYQNLPNEEVKFRHYTNLLLDYNGKTYETSGDIVEPPLQQNISLKQNLKINSGFEPIDVFSPYSAQIDLFSIRNLSTQNSILTKHISGGYTPISDSETVYNKIINAENNFIFNKFEKLEVIYPRTDLIGLAEVRTKSPSYEEEVGSFQIASLDTLDLLTYDINKINYWSDNSYNNNSSKIRSFWRNDSEDRKRTNGNDADNLSSRPETGSLGSFNCLNFPNRKSDPWGSAYFYHENNIYNSMHSMDCNVNYTINSTEDESLQSLILTASGETYGELSPYSHFQLFYLTNIFNNNHVKVQPKISFVHNIFATNDDPLVVNTYERYKDTFLEGTSSIKLVLNKSYQTELDCRIQPSYNSYEEFRANIKHKSQNHSIVPEFIVSRHEDVIKDQFVELFKQKLVKTNFRVDSTTIVNIPNYLTINGGERYDQIRLQDYKVDLKNFIDKKSNKIKFKLNAIKKILPYNGFYPQQRTPQIATIFSDTYLSDTGYITDEQKINISQNGDNGTGIDSDTVTSRTLVAMQPLFNPGILFNTIKAGIAMPWQTMKSVSARVGSAPISDSVCEPYTTFEDYANLDSGSFYFVKDLNVRFPFETILDPLKYYSNALLRNDYVSDVLDFEILDVGVFPYLDPTHKSKDIDITRETTSGGVLNKYTRVVSIQNLLTNFTKADDRLYKSAINNFLAETNSFFCLNEFSSFSTSGDGIVSVESGITYSMDLVIQKNENFSMFNNYKDANFGLIPSASLFGPPVRDAEGFVTSSLDPKVYLPYAPPYLYRDRDILTLSYTPTETKNVQISEIVDNLNINYHTDSGISPYKYKLNVYDSVNYKIISGSSWILQTKFEAPLFKFNNCSLVQTGSATYIAGESINRG